MFCSLNELECRICLQSRGKGGQLCRLAHAVLCYLKLLPTRAKRATAHRLFPSLPACFHRFLRREIAFFLCIAKEACRTPPYVASGLRKRMATRCLAPDRVRTDGGPPPRKALGRPFFDPPPRRPPLLRRHKLLPASRNEGAWRYLAPATKKNSTS